MLPRPSQRSIFHLGEEGGYDHQGADDTTTRHQEGRLDHGRHRRKRDAVDDAGVGLQILVQHHHHTRAPSHSHIVLKQVVLPTAAARHRRGPCGSFLRACSLCLRELSPNKDVYMYRGDQGFCSEECRCQQMLRDEAREHEAMIKKERVRRGLPHHLRHGPRPAPVAAAIRGTPRRPVAVAF
ncbi:hypothetical protein SEVIR_2G223700v4 [Setaria viridis]|nr:uncharacterized protein LOC101753052 [Setaria italica]XP_034578945.1 uncharacterized protein LOC117842579 [Setaria viridis]RCV11791.1 hypothetical protein SETIT_2G214700v2 [Setaria italica]TKW33286.1 hypothetical protein SEVIR_2G223700v2 [Setaria viridis]